MWQDGEGHHMLTVFTVHFKINLNRTTKIYYYKFIGRLVIALFWFFNVAHSLLFPKYKSS